MRILAMCVVLAACGHTGTSDSGPDWTKVAWTPVQAEIEGVKFSALVPDKLPACTVPACWTNDPKPDEEHDIYMPGPTLRVEVRKKTFASPAEFAESVSDDSCLEPKADAQAERFHVACHARHGEPHVEVWIPLDNKRGLRCSARFWAGPNKRGVRAEPPPAEWVEKFCASVKVAAH